MILILCQRGGLSPLAVFGSKVACGKLNARLTLKSGGTLPLNCCPS
jgi:hypothetical protein